MKSIIALALVSIPAHAAIFRTVEAPAGRIDLYDEVGVCLGDAHRAEFTDRHTGAKIPGCWAPLSNELVQVAFLDADVARIPVSALKRLITI